MKRAVLKKKSKELILHSLTKKTKENIAIIKSIENFFIQMRGYVFKMPKPGTPVVVSLSGGADSVITTAILLEEYGLEVFPFFISRGQKAEKPELKSVKYFSKYFSKHYPNLYHKPVIMSVPNPASEIKHLLKESLIEGTGYPMRNSIIIEYGAQYAFGLGSEGVHVRNIFCSFVACDGDFGAQTSMTGLRSLMQHICIDMGDMTWQVTALPLEKEMGFYLEKDDLLRWAKSGDLPVENTRSCFGSQEKHCGVCYACKHRKISFEDARLEDKTKYLDTRASKDLP